jgi:putative NIF3 family GTP cyclohydrolase 1 type 2
MEQLNNVINKLDKLFRLDEFEKDISFCRLFPIAYSGVDYDWRSCFDENYLKRFNGIMIRGEELVGNIFCSVTPTEDVLEEFIERACEGDLLLLHHPVDCENGDPRGNLGRGFVPAKLEQLSKIKERGLSMYSCHIPMDIHQEVGMGIALVKALGGSVTDVFFPIGYGYDGWIFDIKPITTNELIIKLQKIFEVPYLDFHGISLDKITKIAFVPGMGGDVDLIKEAESRGAQAYISGEILCRLDDEYGHKCFDEVYQYMLKSNMTLIGTSHDGSENLTMRTLLMDWIKENINVNQQYISLKKWWR